MPFLFWTEWHFCPISEFLFLSLSLFMSECGVMYEDPLSLERVMECEESGLNLLLELKKSSSRRSSCFPSQDLNKASASSLYFSSSSFISSTDDGQRWLCQHWASSSSSLLPCSSLSLEFTMSWLRLRWQKPIQSKRKRERQCCTWMGSVTKKQQLNNVYQMNFDPCRHLFRHQQSYFFSFLGIITDDFTSLPVVVEISPGAILSSSSPSPKQTC